MKKIFDDDNLNGLYDLLLNGNPLINPEYTQGLKKFVMGLDDASLMTPIEKKAHKEASCDHGYIELRKIITLGG